MKKVRREKSDARAQLLIFQSSSVNYHYYFYYYFMTVRFTLQTWVVTQCWYKCIEQSLPQVRFELLLSETHWVKVVTERFACSSASAQQTFPV